LPQTGTDSKLARGVGGRALPVEQRAKRDNIRRMKKLVDV